MTVRGFTFDGFLVALVAVVVLAVLFPELGMKGGLLHADLVASYGIAGVFFLYGLTLAPDKLRQGAAHWRLHIAVQSGTFILFPVVVLAALYVLGPAVPSPVATGFFMLAAVPSTVSSSVAMTSLARGNVPVAIFNATLSSLIGVFATPLLMAWFVATTGESLPLLPVIAKVLGLVVLPVIVGQIARRWLLGWATRYAKPIRLADRAIILAIVFNAFSNSMIEGIWTRYDPRLVIAMVVAVIALFFVIYGLMKIPCRLLGFDVPDTIACLFCASKKSLATGLPMAKVMFGSVPTLGLIIAPLMLYHFLQLVIVSVIANRFARRAD